MFNPPVVKAVVGIPVGAPVKDGVGIPVCNPVENVPPPIPKDVEGAPKPIGPVVPVVV